MSSMRRAFYSRSPGVTREEGRGLSGRAVCASVSAAVVCMPQACDCGLCRFPSPSPLPPPTQTRFGLWPLPGAADEHGTITRGTLLAPLQGQLLLLPTASWALLCACVTENLPFPGLPILPAELGLHLLGPPFSGRASFGIWRVMVQTCRFSHDKLSWKCFYFTLFGRISLMDIKLWVDFLSLSQNFKDAKLSSGLYCFWCEMKSPVTHVTAPQKAMCLSSQWFFKILYLRHLSWPVMFLGWFSLHLSCMEFSELFFSQIWRGVYFLSFSPCPIPSLFLLLWDPSYMSVRPPDSVYISPWLCVVFSPFFSVLQIGYFL